MYRLIDRSKTPPKGFLWVDSFTTQAAEARNYANWRAQAIEIRVANGNPIPTEEEMEDQMCGRYLPEIRKNFCESYDAQGTVQNYGVGSTLKSMLASIGISACWGCINLAKKMDDWGPDGCEEHMEEIVATMNENASKRNWYKFVPFAEKGSELLVRLAIKRVRDLHSTETA